MTFDPDADAVILRMADDDAKEAVIVALKRAADDILVKAKGAGASLLSATVTLPSGDEFTYRCCWSAPPRNAA